MLNLFEILQNAQGGQAIGNLAKAYDLTQQQVQAALDALLPAFSMGLKQQAGNPATAPNLFAAIAAQNIAAAQSMAAGFGVNAGPFAQAPPQGADMLAAMFGSKEISQAVAAQAAALSGIGTNVLQAMMPALASMLMAGMAQAAAAQPQMQAFLAQMMSGGLFAPPAGPQVQPNPNGGGLLGALLGSLLQQGVQQSAASAPPKPDAVPNPMAQMFETGRQMQQAQIDAFQAIFDANQGKG